MVNHKLLIGADPEIFVRKDGVFHSAHGLVPGTKENPHKVNHGATQVDGMALEFNIDPAATRQEFVTNLTEVMKVLDEMTPGYDLAVAAVADFEADHMAAQPVEALILGCDPDYNAYTGEQNEPPNGDVNFRSAAGHVHVGWTEDVDPMHPDHFEACCMLAKELDCRLALPLLQHDQEQRRRQLYGAPGAFRPKSYGMEYRVLSNKWLDSEGLMKWVYDGVHKAFNNLAAGKRLSGYFNDRLGEYTEYHPAALQAYMPGLMRTAVDHGIVNLPREYRL